MKKTNGGNETLDTNTPWTWNNQRYESYQYEVFATGTESPPEQSLWRAVVMQHLQDSLGKWPKKEAEYLRREAARFFRDERSLGMVCDLAGWEPKMVLAMFTNCLQSGTVPRLVKQFVGTATHNEIYGKPVK